MTTARAAELLEHPAAGRVFTDGTRDLVGALARGEMPLSGAAETRLGQLEAQLAAFEQLAERSPDDGPLDLELSEDASGKPVAVCLLRAPASAPIAWPVPGILLRDINIVAGEAGSGKSTAILAILAAVAGGYPVFGRFPVGEGRPCLHVSEEDDRDVNLNRVEALVQGHGWDRERVLGNLYLHALDGVLLDETDWQLHLAREAQAIGAAVVAFDPTAATMKGNAERNPEIKPVIQFGRALVRAGHAVLFGHHVAKPSEQRQQKAHRVLGGVEWFNGARMVWWAERRDTGMVLECLKSSRTRRPDPLELVRTVRTDPANEAVWLEATMTLGSDSITGKALSDLDLAVLGELCRAIKAPSSTDVRLLVRRAGVKANNEEVAASVAGLMALGLIAWDRVGKAKAWSPTDEGRAAYARARGEQRNAE